MPARQREGIDRGGIQNSDAVTLVRTLRGGDELLDRAIDHGIEPRVLIGAVVGGEDALVLALAAVGAAARCGGGSGRLTWLGVDGRWRQTAAEQQAERDSSRRREAAEISCLFARRLHGLSSVQFYKLDLLRTAGLDSRAIANLDPATHAHTPILERLGTHARRP